MNHRLLAALGLGLLSTASAHAATIVDGPFVNPANQHTYYLLSADTWTASQSFAQSIGGNLATINDAAENTWVFDTFAQRRNLWLGLNDAQAEGVYTWASGESSAYTNWRLGQPDNYSLVGGESYVHMYGTHTNFGGQWNDAQNDPAVYAQFPWFGEVVPLQGVVEVPAVPVPSSLAGGALLLGVGVAASRLRRRRTACAA